MCINNNDNTVMVASDDAEKAMETKVKFLEQIPGCSSDDTIAAYKRKIVRDVKFKHLKLSKLCESPERVIAISSNI